MTDFGREAASAPRIAPPTALMAALVVARVIIVVAGWLAVFLLMFVGYLTLPAIVLSVFAAGFTLFDLVQRRRRKRRVRIG